MSYIKVIQKMIDEGDDIFRIAKLFGGIKKLLELSKSSPYLVALLQTKLGGILTCVADLNQDNWKLKKDEVRFQLNFITLDIELVDLDDVQPFNAIVDIIIPELTELNQMKLLYCWLDDYLLDFGAESGKFNDRGLKSKMIWVYVKSINGNEFINDIKVSDEMVLDIIPNHYKF